MDVDPWYTMPLSFYSERINFVNAFERIKNLNEVLIKTPFKLKFDEMNIWRTQNIV